MDHSLKNYLKQLSTMALLLLLRDENAPTSKTNYPPEIYDSIRKILAERQVAYSQSDPP